MRSTLLRKLLIFILPITIIPLIVVMFFYHTYLYKVLENDIIHFQQKILTHIIKEVPILLADSLKLENHIKHEHIALPEISIFDKDMKMIVNNFDMKNSEEVDKKYNRNFLEYHLKKALQSNNGDILHDKKNYILIKPIMHNNKTVAYVISGYKKTLDEKMLLINQTFLYLIFIMTFTIFIISIFVIIFSLKILHPLNLLIDGIKNITRGNLSFNIVNASNDEIGVVVDAFNDMTLKRKLVEDELRDMAIRDGLTGLYNHKYFYTQLDNEITRGNRYDSPVSLLLIDIDHFKNVNDTYGHRAGDTILRELSKRLMARARNTDFVCRYGGEEITVILIETDTVTAENIAENIRLLIEKEPFLIENGRYVPITVSIGVSSCDESVKESSHIVSNADTALYKAKESGRNRVCVFTKK